MTVYVDDMYRYPMGRFGRMKMSHMQADTTEELLDVADRIGVDRRHLQYPGTRKEHFDVCQIKRALAIEAGAIPLTMKELARRFRSRQLAQKGGA